MTIRSLTSSLTLVAAAGLLQSPAAAQVTSERLYIIDFEEFAEDTKITTQYGKPWNVVFSTPGLPNKPPIVAREGPEPSVAFNSSSGSDTPMPLGEAGLTDPEGAVHNIQMDFMDPVTKIASPVTSVRLYVVDIDGGEKYTLRAYRNGVSVASDTHNDGDPRAHDGKATLFSVRAPEIDKVVLEATAGTSWGYAIDFIQLTRDCAAVQCPLARVQVSQESAAGRGDFDSHVLGRLSYFLTNAGAKELYAYELNEAFSYNGPLITPVRNRTHTLLCSSKEGITLTVVHDEPFTNDNGGGNAEMRVTLEGDCSKASFSVQDEPSGAEDVYSGLPGDCEFTTKQAWTKENTDGFSISGLDEDGTLYLSFSNTDNNVATPTISGLTEWVVYSSDGTTIPLALGADRRVRFLLVPVCAADFNRDGFVTGDDFDAFAIAFENGVIAAVFDRNGFVTGDDFDEFSDAFVLGCD